MRKIRSLQRLPKQLQARVASCNPASDSAFVKAGIPSETLEFLTIGDDARRGLAAVLALGAPIQALRATYPETAEQLKQDAITIGRWVDGLLQKSVRSLESVQLSRRIAAAKASAAVTVSGGLMRQYSRAF